MDELNPPSTDEIEVEAQRFRDNGDEIPYAVYCALLWVLGYGLHKPSELWLDEFSKRTPAALKREQGAK